jgi:hypothetical protein
MRRLTSIVFSLGLFASQMFGPALPRALAQANRASITGTVTDSSGAVVPSVSITATNVDTNVASRTASGNDGVYVVPNLSPGKYSVEFKKDGFETLRLPAITLISTQVARLDGQLPVGSVSTSITVSANAPVPDEERPSMGTNMQGSVITDLPLSIYKWGPVR